MRDTKHTPGPWHVIDFAGFRSIHNEPFYCAVNLLDEAYCENAEANAKLAAAAPTMLEALQRALNIVDLWGAGQHGTITPKECHEGELQALQKMENEIRSAINKALN
jgi:hypothetical protein